MNLDLNPLIIGASTGYRLGQIATWARSAREFAEVDNVVWISTTEIKEQEKQAIAKQAPWLHAIESPASDTRVAPHVQRFEVLAKYFRTYQIPRVVILTDVRDVFFNIPARFYLPLYLPYLKDEVFAGGENMLYRDEPWGSDNLKTGFPAQYESISKAEILNVGVLIGTTETLAGLCELIYLLGSSREGNRIADQSGFNVLANNELLRRKISNIPIDYAGKVVCHLGTLADPRKPEFLAKQIRPLDKFDFREYGIIHQYDRVPEAVAFVYNRLTGNLKR